MLRVEGEIFERMRMLREVCVYAREIRKIGRRGI
jgi:hypothetical protein